MLTTMRTLVTRVGSNFVNGIKKFPARVHPLTPEVE